MAKTASKKSTPAKDSSPKKGARKKISTFAHEFRKTLTTAIIAAFGFLIAFVWRDFITEYVDKIAGLSPVKGKLISALIITCLGVIVILLITPRDPEK
ncbi:MAG: DUF5654 family protein [Nanoarchaeota archaeon]|nr:DUF5654 family protein [Nanoarchaeota archaeon]